MTYYLYADTILLRTNRIKWIVGQTGWHKFIAILCQTDPLSTNDHSYAKDTRSYYIRKNNLI